MRTYYTCALHLMASVVAIMLHNSAVSAPIVLDDFEDGVAFQSGTPNPMPNNTWLEGSDSWNTVASAAQFTNGSPAMKYVDMPNPDGRYENGIYAIFDNKVPETGQYIVRCTAKFKDRLNGGRYYDVIQSFIIGVTVNGSHRGANDAIVQPAIWNLEDQPLDYFSDNIDEWTLDPLELKSPVFTASPGDSLQVILSTDGRYKYYSLTWGEPETGAYVLIDNVELVPVDENGIPTPVSLSTWTLE